MTGQFSVLAPSLAPTLSSYAADWSSLTSSLLPQWQAAVEQQLTNDAEQARNAGNGSSPYSDWHTLAWARSECTKPFLSLSRKSS